MTGDLKAVQSLMGHSTASMTLDLYAHVLNDTLTRAADVMAKGLAEAAEIHGQGTREPDQNSEGSSWARFAPSRVHSGARQRPPPCGEGLREPWSG